MRRDTDDRPLARLGVCFAFEMTSKEPPPAEPVEKRLRMLALFSLPPVGSALNLRRERQILRRRVQRLTRANGLAVELHVLQYGVTRNSLKDVLEQREGWGCYPLFRPRHAWGTDLGAP